MTIPLGECRLVKLSGKNDIPAEFDCGDQDLNEFLLEDAWPYHEQLLGKTYLVYHKDDLAGFFTVSNDKISYGDLTEKHPEEEEKSIINKFRRLLKKEGLCHCKRLLKSFPSVKIGRLAIASKYQGSGIGRQLIDFIKATFVTNNRTGCRFITVDAYEDALKFYEKNGFKYLVKKQNADTEAMFFNLKPFADEFKNKIAAENTALSAD